jgi:HAD superfamily hydrolase (TIGR01509 family)
LTGKVDRASKRAIRSFAPVAMQDSPRLPRRPLGVVFDLDGTLVDSETLVRAGYLAAAERFDVEMTDARFLALVGKPRAANEQQMHGWFGAHFPLQDFYAAVTAHIGGRVAPLKAGAEDLLDRLDEVGAPYALATSSGRDWVSRIFTEHRLHQRFRAAITRDDVTDAKPHPEPYLRAAAALGLAPPDCLAIEDSPTGLRSAHAAGMMTVLAPDLIVPDDESRRMALHVVGNLSDVRTLLDRACA